MDSMKLVEKAVKLAKKRRLNQKALAQMIGADPARISEWKKDQGRPSIDQALALAKAVGVTLDYLADDEREDVEERRGGDDLTRDEQYILTFIRDAELTRKEAIRRLATPPPRSDRRGAVTAAGIRARKRLIEAGRPPKRTPRKDRKGPA